MKTLHTFFCNAASTTPEHQSTSRPLKGHVGDACLRDFYRWHLRLLVS